MDTAGVSTLSDVVRRRIDGSYVVDEWGFDPDFVALLAPLLGARWQISVNGSEHIPGEGAAVLVANRRLGMSEPFAVASAVWQATGRIVRVLGVPDIAPIGPVLRRMGAVQDRPDELAGVLRAGSSRSCSSIASFGWARGSVRSDSDAMVPAVELGVPVIAVRGDGTRAEPQLASAGRHTCRRPHGDRRRSARGRRDDRRGPRWRSKRSSITAREPRDSERRDAPRLRHLRQTRRSARAPHPRVGCRSHRGTAPTRCAGAALPNDRHGQPRGRTIRQAEGALPPRRHGRRCRASARRVRGRVCARDGPLDGWRDRRLLALRHPNTLRSLVLSATACHHHMWRRELLAEWASVALEQGMREVSRRSMRWLVGPRSLRRDWPALGVLGPLALNVPAHPFAAQARAILDTDDSLRDRLVEVRVPTLVVSGSQDILTPTADGEELAERIPGADLSIISRRGARLPRRARLRVQQARARDSSPPGLMSRRTHSPFNHQSRAVGGDSAALHLGEAERSCGTSARLPRRRSGPAPRGSGTGPGCPAWPRCTARSGA